MCLVVTGNVDEWTMVYGRNELVFMDANVFFFMVYNIYKPTNTDWWFGTWIWWFTHIDSMVIFHSYNWYNNWLVVWDMNFIKPCNSWDDDPIWRTPSFFRGVGIPPASHLFVSLSLSWLSLLLSLCFVFVVLVDDADDRGGIRCIRVFVQVRKLPLVILAMGQVLLESSAIPWAPTNWMNSGKSFSFLL